MTAVRLRSVVHAVGRCCDGAETENSSRIHIRFCHRRGAHGGLRVVDHFVIDHQKSDLHRDGRGLQTGGVKLPSQVNRASEHLQRRGVA